MHLWVDGRDAVAEMEQRAQVELVAVSLAERSVVTPHLEVAQVVVVVVSHWVELGKR